MIAYLSHRIGSTENFEALRARHDNIANAVSWVAYLTSITPWVISVPWFVNVAALGHLLHDRALNDQLKFMARHDSLVIVGPPPSGHQHVEIAHARRKRLAVIDLTTLGPYPPAARLPFGYDDAPSLRLHVFRIAAEALARARIRL